jgi:hypothetical protein
MIVRRFTVDRIINNKAATGINPTLTHDLFKQAELLPISAFWFVIILVTVSLA